MLEDKEKAQIISKLIRGKGNWGSKYDRLEHYKRFPNLNQIVKNLQKTGWILVKKKPNYVGISLNTNFKKEIVEFIEKNMPEMAGWIS
jgi:hypothetical protein